MRDSVLPPRIDRGQTCYMYEPGASGYTAAKNMTEHMDNETKFVPQVMLSWEPRNGVSGRQFTVEAIYDLDGLWFIDGDPPDPRAFVEIDEVGFEFPPIFVLRDVEEGSYEVWPQVAEHENTVLASYVLIRWICKESPVDPNRPQDAEGRARLLSVMRQAARRHQKLDEILADHGEQHDGEC